MKLKTGLLFFVATAAMSAPAFADDAANRESGTQAEAEAEAAQPSANAKPPVEIFSTGMAKGRDRPGSAASTSALKGDDSQRFGPRPLAHVLRTVAGLRIANGIGEGNNNSTVRTVQASLALSF